MPNMPALPQDTTASEQENRLRELYKRQERYQYDHEYLDPRPVVKGFPGAEFFSASYVFRQVAQLSVVVANLAVAGAKCIFDRFNELQDYGDLFPLLPDPSTKRPFKPSPNRIKQSKVRLPLADSSWPTTPSSKG